MGKEHWIVPLLQKKWASIFCTSTLALTAHRTSDQASIWQRTRSSFALQQLEEGRILLKIMELQKCEGGVTGEQNETQCILTSSNCKTGFYARCLRCQLKMVILAKGSVTALYKPLGPELGNAAVTKAEWGQHGDNMQVITRCVSFPTVKFSGKLWKTKTIRALRESTHLPLSCTKCHHQPSDWLQKQWQVPLKQFHQVLFSLG